MVYIRYTGASSSPVRLTVPQKLYINEYICVYRIEMAQNCATKQTAAFTEETVTDDLAIRNHTS